jgi:hypothetical protein
VKGSDGAIQHVETIRDSLAEVDWSDEPMAARRAARLADQALSDSVQAMRDEDGHKNHQGGTDGD